MKKENRKLTFKNIEIRSNENDGKKYIEGIIPYNSKSVPMWGVTEIIDKTAFNKTLSDNTEIRALWNHNDSHILGSTKSETLILTNTDNGLICKCQLPNTSYANDLYEIINRGDVKTMSFGFIPIKCIDDEKRKIRTIKEAQLLEISYGVTFPAFPETNSVTFMRGLEKNNIDINKLNETLEKEEFNDDDKAIITNTVNLLNGILGRNSEAAETEQKETTPEKSGTSIENTESLLLQIETELTI